MKGGGEVINREGWGGEKVIGVHWIMAQESMRGVWGGRKGGT